MEKQKRPVGRPRLCDDSRQINVGVVTVSPEQDEAFQRLIYATGSIAEAFRRLLDIRAACISVSKIVR